MELLQYNFIVRAFEAGILIGIVAPIIGLFLVLKRYSLIADTLAHVSLAGVAIGLLCKINPIFMAIVASTVSSLGMEKLRQSRKLFGESALALFLSGSLAVAVVIIGLANGFTVDLFSYLFGSIVTVTQNDVYIIALATALILLGVGILFKELIFITFDEEAARIQGLPVTAMNTLFLFFAALTIALAIPIIGVLLISALVVLPPVTALLFQKNFIQTMAIAVCQSVITVVAGIILSFYTNLATGGLIVLLNLLIFTVVWFLKKK